MDFFITKLKTKGNMSEKGQFFLKLPHPETIILTNKNYSQLGVNYIFFLLESVTVITSVESSTIE